MKQHESEDQRHGRLPTRLTRRQFVRAAAGIAGAAAAAPLFAACAPSPAAPAASQPQATVPPIKSEIVVAYGVPVVNLDPQVNGVTATESVLRNMYEALLAFAPDMRALQPALATQWTQLDDLTVQFKLRENVKFHNGEEFDANAVKFSIERLLNPDTKVPYLSNYTTIDRVDILDKYTVNIMTKGPDAVFLRRMAGFHTNIVPPKYFSSASAEELASKPVGTGPYKFVSWVKDADLVMQSNSDYWGGEPNIKKVVVRGIPESSTRVAALLAGDVDIITAVPSDDAERINSSGKARVLSVEGNRVVFFYFVVTTPPLENKLVRQALNYGSNIDGVIKTVLGGRGFRRATYANPWYAGADPSVEPFPYDPEKAKALLAEAGHADGFEVNLYTSIGRVAKDKEVAEAVAGELAKIGVRAKVIPLEWGTFVSMNNAGQLDGMWLATWGNYMHDCDISLYTQMHSSTTQTRMFNKGYKNAELDAVLEEARSTIDLTKRTELYTKAQLMAKEDPNAIFGYTNEDMYGVSTRIEWQPRSDEMIWHKDMRLKA